MALNVNLAGDWVTIRDVIHRQIEEHRSRLEGRLSHDESNFERGAIDALKSIINTVEPTPTIDIQDTSNYG